MRRTLFVVLFALLSVGSVHAQQQPYRVVFDLTSRDTLEQRAVLRWLREVGTSSPDAQMEVVMYARGFELVMPDRSACRRSFSMSSSKRVDTLIRERSVRKASLPRT